MAIFSFRPLFRTRNPLRDSMTDAARIGSVRQALEDALNEAARERAGLQKRLDFYHAQAANLLDISGEYGERNQGDEDAINAAEANARRAQARIDELIAQTAHLTQLLEQLEPATQSATQAHSA
jgi:chromosome segregation ATPase